MGVAWGAMTKRNLTKIGTAILKWIAVATALLNLPELQEALGENATWAATGFAAASALKDTLVTVLDYLDDGKANNSFNFPGKTLGLLMIVGLGFLLLPSCGGTWGGLCDWSPGGGNRSRGDYRSGGDLG